MASDDSFFSTIKEFFRQFIQAIKDLFNKRVREERIKKETGMQ